MFGKIPVVCNFAKCLATPFGDRSFRLRVVLLTSHSLTSYVVPLKKRNERYECIYFVPSAMIQESEIRMHIPRSFCH